MGHPATEFKQLSPEELRELYVNSLECALLYAREALFRAQVHGYRTGCLSEAVRNLEGALKFVKYGDGAMP